MGALTTGAFDLSGRLAPKADPALIAGDEHHFANIAESLEQSIADLSDRVDAARREPGGTGQEAMDRDLEIHRLTARLRALRRFGLDLCLGHMVGADDPEPVYVGRLGLTDSAGRRLLVDWRSPAAEPFFGATHANPMGLVSRRRYRWTRGRVSAAVSETDPDVARLKSSADMVKAVEPAVRLYEEPPTEGMVVETPWSDIWLGAGDWAEVFESPDPGAPHNEARDQVWDELLTILTDKHGDDDDVSPDLLRRSLRQNRALVDTFNRAWPLLDYTDLVGDLWSVPAYLRMCAPWLGPDEVRKLQRQDAHAWTVSDLPLLDAARQRLGDPEAPRRRRRHEAAVAAEREHMSRVVDDLIAADDSDMLVMSMLRGRDLQDALVDETALPSADPDLLAGPFAHIVVDEAQELTDAEWQMLLRRCPSRSLTIVGDRAQARHGFSESWQDRLERIGLDNINLASLSINYRTPEEVMAAAEPVIRAVLPDANVPTSVRSGGVPVVHGSVSDLGSVLGTWLAEHADGIACVVDGSEIEGGMRGATSRVRWLTPQLSKGLEFDLVVLIDPEAFGKGIEGVVDRYVAMTRATQRLVILTST